MYDNYIKFQEAGKNSIDNFEQFSKKINSITLELDASDIGHTLIDTTLTTLSTIINELSHNFDVGQG